MASATNIPVRSRRAFEGGNVTLSLSLYEAAALYLIMWRTGGDPAGLRGYFSGYHGSDEKAILGALIEALPAPVIEAVNNLKDRFMPEALYFPGPDKAASAKVFEAAVDKAVESVQ